jgi:hypothetical protein
VLRLGKRFALRNDVSQVAVSESWQSGLNVEIRNSAANISRIGIYCDRSDIRSLGPFLSFEVAQIWDFEQRKSRIQRRSRTAESLAIESFTRESLIRELLVRELLVRELLVRELLVRELLVRELLIYL